ncbi:cytochrome P450 (plasmid) [Streptomyces atratus]|uniref:Cytochrome P450 n=1 Tax=Streptomyces atratus TaxID=1893 RepID=A0A1K2A069_STRAR|nr:cytochrome P450 [Streptomyces atratus]SFX79777.1 Cytochrome P450 [Streptomyces atratus]
MTADEKRLPLHRLTFAAPGPPRHTTLPGGSPAWHFTRYDDVRQVLADDRFTRAMLPATATSPLIETPDAMTKQDGAGHLRLRHTVKGVLTPRGVGRVTPMVAEVADRLVADLAEHGPPTDLVDHYTRPLPIAVMNKLLGVHDVDDTRLLRWTELAFPDPSVPEDETADAAREFTEFATRLMAERRSTPGPDLISTLVQTADREGGIPESRLVNFVSTLVVAGYDTTMTMLGNALLYLLDERPEDWARLGSDEAAAGAVADRLTHLIPLNDPAKHFNPLRATEDVEIGGVTIRAGDLVTLDRGAANRDPVAFPGDPFVDLFAPLEHPTLAFGGGQHYCLGVSLARTELRLALHRLAARLPDLRLTVPVEAVEWRRSALTRSPRNLPVTW